MTGIMTSWNPSAVLPDAFLDLPARIYANDPFWLGEDPASVRQQFSALNPWFDEGQAWVGVVPGKARLAGFVVPGQLVDGEQAAFFGFWETINELEANLQLFDELKSWARVHGATRLYGPINFTTFGANRVRLDGFEHGAFPGEPWNPDYYPVLLEQLGLDIRYRYISTFAKVDEIIPPVKRDYLRVKPQLEQAIRFKPMTADYWVDHLDELYGFVGQVFGANFAYTPISLETFRQVCGPDFARKFCPQTSVLAESLDGRIAGFFLVYPDYGPLMRQTLPAPLPTALVDYDSCAALLPQPRLALAKTGGVHPDFRTFGLFTAMSCELTLRAEGVYDEIAGALVREDNASLNFAARHGTARHHHYALFGTPL
ncbi:hypothetical protein EV700_0098 [Fluviicoccus keumensis]|uniref:N-acetyltransferase domain-containing protein n=1 Tax=Fluviicoccus keumensis TaxID=1435465 RepID=A0A4Q7ZC25_9GAMM|nr:hypothetical protein [Fluviicoccus keumensis]RZU48197.1 hypothetical protein EV700_0098 [Fluviicoccus keumensis]